MDINSFFARKNSKLIFTVIILIAVYLGLIFAAPRMTVWNRNTVITPENPIPTTISDRQQFEFSFVSPYDFINTIEISFTDAGDAMTVIIPIDGHLELIGPDGSVVLEKDITSIYDIKAGSGYIPVTKDAEYTVRLEINHIENPYGASLPQLNASSNGEFEFQISGRYNGAPSKETFTIIYLLFSAVIALYVYTSDRPSHSLAKISEKLLLITISFFSIFLLSQVFDSLMIIKGCFKLIEAAQSGKLFSFYDYSYNTSLIPGGSQLLLSINYDFFFYLPIAILLFPFSFFVNSNDMLNGTFTLALIYFGILLFILIIGSDKLIGMICRECKLDNESENEVRRFFIFSPFLLSVTIVLGQADMFYIILIIAALLMYVKGNLIAFTALMSFAISIKTLPIMIFIPLILLVRKKLLSIIGYGIAGLIPSLISSLLFKHGIGYNAIMNMLYNEYDFTGLLFKSTLGTNNAIIPVCFALICIYAYMHSEHFENMKELLRTSMTLIFAIYSSLAVFTECHSQWLIPLVISLAFLVPMYKNNRGVLLLGVVAEILLLLYNHGNKSWSMYMTNFTLPSIFGYSYNGPTMTGVYNNIAPWCFLLLTSLLSAVLGALCYVFFKKDPSSEVKEPGLLTIKQTACLRITALYAIVTLFFWCYWYVG